jgi:hypothetical protein
MKLSKHILAVSLVLGALSAEKSHAQMSPMMMPAAAPVTMAPSVPQFMPVSGWSVEKTEFAQARGLQGVRLPCMMAASFDNGYIVRLSGNSGQMLAMAVDFRQNVFTQGRKYPANIGLNQAGGFNTTATAFSESTLIFNLRSINEFYQQLLSANALTLDVDGNAFVFGLGNVPEALNRLEACFGGSSGSPVVPAGTVVEPQMPQEKRNNTNTVRDWNQKVDPVAPTSQPAPQAPATMRWIANAGDDIRSTLERWSKRAGVALAWESDRGGQVVNDINVNGTFEQAVQMLMAQNATALGIDAMMAGQGMTQNAGMSLGGPSASQISTRPQPITPALRGDVPEPLPPSKWMAPAGADLQVVLKEWSKRAGVDFVWQAHHGFQLKRAVSGDQSYEAALQAVLSQFASDGVRPAAQLNNDPTTGQKLLVVQSTRVL